jgi:hypothetical protein
MRREGERENPENDGAAAGQHLNGDGARERGLSHFTLAGSACPPRSASGGQLAGTAPQFDLNQRRPTCDSTTLPRSARLAVPAVRRVGGLHCRGGRPDADLRVVTGCGGDTLLSAETGGGLRPFRARSLRLEGRFDRGDLRARSPAPRNDRPTGSLHCGGPPPGPVPPAPPAATWKGCPGLSRAT